MDLHTMYLINSFAYPGYICSIFLLMAWFMVIFSTQSRCSEDMALNFMISVVIICVALFVFMGIHNYTNMFADVYVMQLKGQAVHEGLKGLEYDKILEFIKEVKK